MSEGLIIAITFWLVITTVFGIIWMCAEAGERHGYWKGLGDEGFKVKHLFWGCAFPIVLIVTLIFFIAGWHRLWNKRLFGGEKK